MGLFKQAEFAQKCGIEQAYLTMYRKRGKVIVNEDGMVDDANTTNILFMQKCLTRVPKVVEEKLEVEKTEAKSQPSKTKKGQKAQISEKKSKSSQKAVEKADERFDLDTEKKRMEIENLRREARLNDAKEEKMLGKLIPTDPVKSLFMQTIKAYTMSFKQAADKIVLEFGKRSKMNRNDLAEMRGELIAAINKASEEGITESKKGVQNIVREYSEAKKS